MSAGMASVRASTPASALARSAWVPAHMRRHGCRARARAAKGAVARRRPPERHAAEERADRRIPRVGEPGRSPRRRLAAWRWTTAQSTPIRINAHLSAFWQPSLRRKLSVKSVFRLAFGWLLGGPTHRGAAHSPREQVLTDTDIDNAVPLQGGRPERPCLFVS